MKSMVMKMMIINCSMTPMIKSPLILGMMLVMHTTLMIILINKIMISSWFAMISFLMMIGGLLILFMYMSSIESNQKLKININLTLIMLVMMMITDEMMITNQINEQQNMMNQELEISLIKIYNKKSMILTMMLVIYLLLTMIGASKIVSCNKGPLRLFKKYE